MLTGVLYFIVGIILLPLAADRAVKYAAALAKKTGIDKYGVGAGIVATITSLPELFVACFAVAKGDPEVAVGIAFGSAVALFLLSLGILAVMGKLALPKRRKKELAGAILITIIVTLLSVITRTISTFLGIALAITYVLYIKHLHEGKISEIAANKRKAQQAWKTVLKLALAITGVVLAAHLVVSGVETVSKAIGIAPFFVAFFIIAIGTNLPELSVEIAAASKGHEEIAIGDILGSAVADLTLVLGAAAIVGALTGNHVIFNGGAHVAAGIMLGASLLLLKLETEQKVTPMEGVMLILAYILVIWTELLIG